MANSITSPSIHSSAFSLEESWSKLLAQKRQIPLYQIFQWLSIPELEQLQNCKNQKFVDLMHFCQMSSSPEHILEITDQMISKGKIFEAEKFLRPYVCQPGVSVKIINRYILILHSYIFNNEKNFLCEKQRIDIIVHFLEEANKKSPIDPNLYDKILDHISKKTNILPVRVIDTTVHPEKCKFTRSYEVVHNIYDEKNYPFINKHFDSKFVAHCFVAYICFKYAITNGILESIESFAYDSPLFNWMKGVEYHYVYGNYQKSYHHYIKSIKHSPGFAYSSYSLGCLTQNITDVVISYGAEPYQKIFNEAKMLYHYAQRIDSKHHLAMLNHVLMIDDPDLETISEMYEHVRRIHPSYTYTQRSWVSFIICNNLLSKEFTIELMEEALHVSPHCPENHVMIANILHQEDKIYEAIQHYKRYLSIPSNIIYKNGALQPSDESTKYVVQSLVDHYSFII